MAWIVNECPYCGGTDPHQGPTGCPPIKWPPDPKPNPLEWDETWGFVNLDLKEEHRD